MLDPTREQREDIVDPGNESDGHVNWTADSAAPAQPASGVSGSRASREAVDETQGQDDNAEPPLAGVGTVAGLVVGHNKHARDIEQGPPAVRVLAFAGSGVSALLSAVAIFNPMVLLGSPIVWTITAYQGVFSITTLVFEAKPEWIQSCSSSLDHYQDYVMNNAAFLATCLGRGLFYIFQGTLWGAVGHSMPIDDNRPLEYTFLFIFEMTSHVLGFHFLLLGTMELLMHYNLLPQHTARKIRRGSILVTDRVATALDQLRERRGQARQANSQAPAASASVPLREGGSEVELPSR